MTGHRSSGTNSLHASRAISSQATNSLFIRPMLPLIARFAAALRGRYGDGGFTARPKGYDFSILDRSKGAGAVPPDDDSTDKIDSVTHFTRSHQAAHKQDVTSLHDMRPC
jgi:hypothetical protein